MRTLRAAIAVTGAALLLLATPAAASPSSQSPGPPSLRSSAGQWTTAGQLLVMRDHPEAVLLRDGRVLVTGGTAAVRATSAELYDPATGSSTLTGPTHVVRIWASMIRLASGRVLLTGGYSHGRPVRATEIYDPATGSWQLVAPLNHGRFGAGIALLPHGRVMVAGGQTYGRHPFRVSRSAEIYRPAQDRWVSTAPMRWPHAANQGSPSIAVLRNGDALVAGTNHSDGVTSSWAERYDASRHAWVPAGELSSPRSPALIRLPSGQVLAVAGEQPWYNSAGHDPVDRYLPRGNRWVSDSRLPGPFVTPGLVMVGGRPFAVGPCPARGPTRPCPAVARYVPGTRTWVAAAPMPDSRMYFATVRLPDRSVLVIAGVYRPPMSEYRPISSVLRWSAA